MRIHYTMPWMGLTGGLRVLVEVANGLQKRGHDVTLGAPIPPQMEVPYTLVARLDRYLTKTDWYKREITKRLLGTSFRHFGMMNDLELLSRKAPDCDINVAAVWFTAYSVAGSGKGVGVYHMQHYEAFMERDPLMSKMADMTYHLPLNKIANSIWLRDRMKEKLGVELPVVNPAIDHAVFHPRGKGEERKRPRVLCFGKNYDWKGFGDASQAFLRIQKVRPDVEFVVYGAELPPVPDGLKVTFVQKPSDDELAKLYSSADVVLCPSWYESFPLPPIEAMACGAPVVTTRYGTEDYAHHEKNALVIEPRKPDVMADAVLRLLDDRALAESLAKEGQRTAKQFTWDHTVDQVEALFRQWVKKA